MSKFLMSVITTVFLIFVVETADSQDVEVNGWFEVSSSGGIRYLVEQDKVVRVENLSLGCDPGHEDNISGTVVERRYADDAMSIIGFILEYDEGSRDYINVDDKWNGDFSLVSLGWLRQGIEQITKKGTEIEINALRCGAAGRVIILDDIQYLSREGETREPTPPVTPNEKYGADYNDAAMADRVPVEDEREKLSVSLVKEGGVFRVPVTINDAIELHFVLDSGASDVTIPEDVFSVLTRTKTVSENDILGTQKYMLADGTIASSPTFRIRSLTIGGYTLRNVSASVASGDAPLLLGQSFLSRFDGWAIDNRKGVVILNLGQ